MFTGIVTHIGTIAGLTLQERHDLIITVKFEDNNFRRSLEKGCSVSCSGICLTLINKKAQDGCFYLDFAASMETINKTNIGNWQKGTKINLEFALRAGDELGGHLVSGHIDDTAIIKGIKKESDSHQFTFEITEALARFICPKGSVTLDGISLTVNQVNDNRFTVNIIKHSFDNTVLQYAKIGDKVNLEIDIIARYLNKLINQKNG